MTNPPITILGNRVLAIMETHIAAIQKKEGSKIIIAQTFQQEQKENGYAKIVALGDEVKSEIIKRAFKNGQLIYVGNFIGISMIHDGVKYQLLHVPDIFAVVP